MLAVCAVRAGTGAPPSFARTTPLALAPQHLGLPGVPVKTLSGDFDRDGVRDLAVVVASTSWGESGYSEPMQVDASGTFVDVLTVVPTLFDRRQLLVFRGLEKGGFSTAPDQLDLPPSVHALEAGPSGAPLVVWTDEGLGEVRFSSSGGPELLPRVAARSLLGGSRSFVPQSGLARDLDGDGERDLLVPEEGGLALFLGSPGGIALAPVTLLAPPESFTPPAAADAKKGDEKISVSERRELERSRRAKREVPLPESVDLDGDRLPDLLYRDPEARGKHLRARRNLGGGRFGSFFDPLAGATLPEHEEIAWVGDLDGDGGAELVVQEELENKDESMRAELREAKRPRSLLRVHAVDRLGRWNPEPRSKFEIEGYLFDSGGDDGSEGAAGARFELPSGVRDLDGDGRLDLVAIRLDFSLFEAMRVMTTHTIRLGLDFAIYHQGPGLRFSPVSGLDLSGEMKLRLDDVSLGQISSFAGDFDGDGRAEFVQLGHGRRVTIHRGQAEARYAPDPDLAVTLDQEPADVALVAVRDLDGDGRSDLAVTQPVGRGDVGARAVLELYLSRGGP